jgi:signal transduction histidine kinase
MVTSRLFTDDQVQLNVSDDGAGFQPGRVTEVTLGIVGMVERAGLVGGTLDIDSRPGNGTSLRAVIPIPGAAAPVMPTR